jgi:hypothetical protein
VHALLLQLADAAGPAVGWILIVLAVVVAIIVLYAGIALCAALRARDHEQQQVRYQMFRDLLDLIRDLFRSRGPR